MKFSVKIYSESGFFSEQSTSADPTTSRSSIRPHSEFSSTVFCDRHPSYLLRYFCESAICEIPICEECWENDHKDESHRVILLKFHMESQQEIVNRLAKYKSEFQGAPQFLEVEWENMLRQVKIAEKKQQDVMQSESANEFKSNSIETRDVLKLHWKYVNQFKLKCLSKFDDLQESFESIFGNLVENTESSSLNNGAQKSILSEIKKRELVRMTKRSVKTNNEIINTAVYNSSTNEIISSAFQNWDVVAFCINETSREIEVKRKLNRQSLRGTEWGAEDILLELAMDGKNTLYGVIWQVSDKIRRLVVLDQNNLAEIEQLDTQEIENGSRPSWKIGAFGDTVAVAVYHTDLSYETKWTTVTVFKNQRRQHTVSLNISLPSIFASFILANETTLLLSGGNKGNEIAVVWLTPLSMPGSVSDSRSASNASSQPQYSASVTNSTTTATDHLRSSVAVNPRSVRFLNLSIDGVIRNFVWIASNDMPLTKSPEGYLFVSEAYPDFTLHVFEVDFEKILSTKEHGREMVLQHMSKITPLKNAQVVCPISNSKIVATLASKFESCGIMLLDLEYQNVH